MLSKIYLAILGLSLISMAFFSFYSWSWLQSIGLPATAASGYEYHAGIAWTLLWITTTILLLLGNAILWTSNRSWAMWVAFVFFASMAVLRSLWLDQAYLQFRKTSNLLESGLDLGPFVAVVMISVIAAVVFFDHFIILRLRQKMHPPVDPVVGEASPESKTAA